MADKDEYSTNPLGWRGPTDAARVDKLNDLEQSANTPEAVREGKEWYAGLRELENIAPAQEATVLHGVEKIRQSLKGLRAHEQGHLLDEITNASREELLQKRSGKDLLDRCIEQKNAEAVIAILGRLTDADIVARQAQLESLLKIHALSEHDDKPYGIINKEDRLSIGAKLQLAIDHVQNGGRPKTGEQLKAEIATLVADGDTYAKESHEWLQRMKTSREARALAAIAAKFRE